MRAVEATELIALDVFNTGGRQITLSDVQRYLCELRSHPPECECRDAVANGKHPMARKTICNAETPP